MIIIGWQHTDNFRKPSRLYVSVEEQVFEVHCGRLLLFAFSLTGGSWLLYRVGAFQMTKAKPHLSASLSNP